jgi:putative ATPase
MDCLPDNLRGRRYYHPTTEGKEKLFGQRLNDIRRLREQAGKENLTADDTDTR